MAWLPAAGLCDQWRPGCPAALARPPSAGAHLPFTQELCCSRNVWGHEAVLVPGPGAGHKCRREAVWQCSQAHLTTLRTSLYTASRGGVVFLGRRNSSPWHAHSSSMAST